MANNFAVNPIVIDTTTATTQTLAFPIKLKKAVLVAAAATSAVQVMEAISGKTIVDIRNGVTQSTLSQDFAVPLPVSTKVSGITTTVAGSGAILYLYY